MITKNELKYYSSLLKKKFREEEKKFIAEGEKIVIEGLKSNFNCEKIFTTHEFYKNKKDYLDDLFSNVKIEIIKNQDFKKISDTVHFQGLAAVFDIPQNKNHIGQISSNLIVGLDNISDPGNVGTILRNCDWFGINEVILTSGCAEIYNPKTIRASMGSIFHLKIFEETDSTLLSNLKYKDYKLLTADVKGENINRYKFPEKAVIIFSNEAWGPAPDILDISDNIITIPKYGNAESLNVASASAIILSKIKTQE
jgi:TrmH family RNA methyltransferase